MKNILQSLQIFDTYMDLGRMAICKAALKWDESKGTFGTYLLGYYVQK